MANDYVYQGSELDLFALAVNWKTYWKSQVVPYVSGDVLEVGAGLGGTTKMFADTNHRSWHCLEPDPRLVGRLNDLAASGTFPSGIRVRTGSIADLNPDERFDTILYIDVLEHIENDGGEMIRAAERLKPGGHLIVLCPAHQFLFSPFDKAIGHYRRYNKSLYRAVTPDGLKLVVLKYLDCVGMLLSLANRLLLRSSAPSEKQILFWDRRVIPFSRVLDKVTFGAIGKTILGVFRKVTS